MHAQTPETGPAAPLARGIDTPEHLAEHLRPYLDGRAAIVCVGNEMLGDDGAGTAVARRLAGNVPWDVYDTQTVPESFLMKIVAGRPDAVVLIDALDFRAECGAVELIEHEHVTGQGPSTHGPAPIAFLDVLRMIHPCRQVVLGIQPEQCEWGRGLSEPVRLAVDRVVRAFTLAGADRAGSGG